MELTANRAAWWRVHTTVWPGSEQQELVSMVTDVMSRSQLQAVQLSSPSLSLVSTTPTSWRFRCLEVKMLNVAFAVAGVYWQYWSRPGVLLRQHCTSCDINILFNFLPISKLWSQSIHWLGYQQSKGLGKISFLFYQFMLIIVIIQISNFKYKMLSNWLYLSLLDLWRPKLLSQHFVLL